MRVLILVIITFQICSYSLVNFYSAWFSQEADTSRLYRACRLTSFTCNNTSIATAVLPNHDFISSVFQWLYIFCTCSKCVVEGFWLVLGIFLACYWHEQLFEYLQLLCGSSWHAGYTQVTVSKGINGNMHWVQVVVKAMSMNRMINMSPSNDKHTIPWCITTFPTSEYQK